MRPPSLWIVSLVALAACAGSPAPPQAASPPPASSEPAAKPDTTTAPAVDDPESGCPPHMVRVPGGTLWLGSPDGAGASDEHPMTKVEVSELCLDASEVTVDEYRACAKNKACPALPTEVRLLTAVSSGEHAELSALCSARLSDNAGLPATCVSHADAGRYCAWKGHRLPSEAEWEWAATGGDDKLPWPWGISLPSDANVCWQRQRGPCTTRSKPAGAFGTFDMAGNVSEWTDTAYAPYGGAAADPGRKVVRGGSWESTKEIELSPKHRASRPADYRDVTIGFRCALAR